MRKMRLIIDKPRKGAMNMSIDEAMLNVRIKGGATDTLRIYKWNPACASIGFFQSLEKEIDMDKIKENGFDVVRRYTGGGAVFHKNELTYSIVISEKYVSEDIIESYSQICQGLINMFKLLGLKAEFKPINDIVIDGKKISGNAQTRKGGVVLMHGTIILDVDIKEMFSVLKVPNEKIRDKMISAVSERVTSLKQLGCKTDIEAELIKGFSKALNVDFYMKSLSEDEIIEANKLYENKYNNSEWISCR